MFLASHGFVFCILMVHVNSLCDYFKKQILPFQCFLISSLKIILRWIEVNLFIWFVWQKDNVSNQREHVVHLLANEQSRLRIPEEPEPVGLMSCLGMILLEHSCSGSSIYSCFIGQYLVIKFGWLMESSYILHVPRRHEVTMHCLCSVSFH